MLRIYFGVGAVLLQDGQPISHASTVLTECERAYAQIEKELLAIVYGLERFDQYTYERPKEVQSDHKPLEIIVRESLQTVPRRLQAMLLRLKIYDLKVVYKKGKEMVLVDTLSRAHLTIESRSSTVENSLEILNAQSTFEKKSEQVAAVDCYFITNKQVTRDSARNSG